MISDFFAGWCKVRIGEWNDTVSYLTDVPVDLLNGMILIYKNKNSEVIVRMDTEHYDVFLKFCLNDKVQIKSECNRIITINVDMNALASELISDVRSNIDECSRWDYDSDMPNYDYIGRKEYLLYLCDELERLIKNNSGNKGQ